jgi:hypothetical protein
VNKNLTEAQPGPNRLLENFAQIDSRIPNKRFLKDLKKSAGPWFSMVKMDLMMAMRELSPFPLCGML